MLADLSLLLSALAFAFSNDNEEVGWSEGYLSLERESLSRLRLKNKVDLAKKQRKEQNDRLHDHLLLSVLVPTPLGTG